MKTKPIQRMLSIISALALLLTVFAVPAFAALPSAVASLADEDRQVLANTENVFDLTVTNSGAAGDLLTDPDASIKFVLFELSPSMADLYPDVQDSEGRPTAPPGWEGPINYRDQDNQIAFWTADDGSAIDPGESLDFRVLGSVAESDRDRTLFKFQVRVADNEQGQTTAAAAPAGDGALNTVLRILSIRGISISAPARAVDLSVTDGQDNTVVRVEVANNGSADVSGLPVLAKESGSSNFTVTDDPAQRDPADSTPVPTAQTIPAGGSTTFDFPVNFAGVGSLDLGATLQTATAEALPPSDIPTITVQEKTALQYVGGSLRPTDIAAAKKDISLVLDKTGAPTAALTLDGTFSHESDPDSEVVAPSSETATAGEGQNLVEVTFPQVPFDEAGLADGNYAPSVSASGIDGNDARIDIPSISINDRIYLDTLAPVLNIIDFLAPASEVEHERDAATNGDTFTLNGTVEDRGQGCPDCQVTGTLSIPNQAETTTFTVESINQDGSFSYAVPVAGAPDNVQSAVATLSLKAVDATEEDDADHTDTASATGLVDTRAPHLDFTRPLTGGLGEAIDEAESKSRIDVLFDEGIAASFRTTPANWTVEGTGGRAITVQDAEIRTAELAAPLAFPGSSASLPAGTRVWFVELSLGSELGGNEQATVTYIPEDRIGTGLGELTGTTRVFDRVDFGLPRGIKNTIDNIAPLKPVIDIVGSRGLQTDDDGEAKFFTNDTTPTIAISSVEPQAFIEVFRREADGTTVKIGEGDFTGDSTGTMTFEDANIGADDRQFEIFATASDAGVKKAIGDPVKTVLDQVSPNPLRAVFDGGDVVTIEADEALAWGDDDHSNWFARALLDGGTVSIFADAVSASDTLAKRAVTLNDDSYDPAHEAITLDAAIYDFKTGTEQYTDRAGNLLHRRVEFPVTTAESGSSGATGTGTSTDSGSSSLVGRVVDGVLGG